MDQDVNQLPALPEGASLDTDALPALPEGATLDSQSSDALPPLPDGATLDQEAPNLLSALPRGVQASMEQLGTSAALAVGGKQNYGPQTYNPAQEPFGLEDLKHPIDQGLPKFLYKLGESTPTIEGGVVGGIAGSPLGPPGEIVGGMLGAAAGNAAQTIGPAFQAELQKTPDDKEGAFRRAMETTANSGGFSAIGWGLGAVPFFQSAVKQILFQSTVVQPAVVATQQASQNVIEGKPASQGVVDAYGQGVVQGVGFEAGHAGIRKATTGSFFPQPGGVRPGVDEPANLPPLPDGATLDTPIQPDLRDLAISTGKTIAHPFEKTNMQGLPKELQGQQFNETPGAQQMTGPEVTWATEGAAGYRGMNPHDTNDLSPQTPQQQAQADLSLRRSESGLQVLPGGMDEFTKAVVNPTRPTQDSTDMVEIPPRFDVTESAATMQPLLDEVRQDTLKEPFYENERKMDLNSRIPRYALDNGRDFHLYNSTDLEAQLAVRGNQELMPEIHEVYLPTLDHTKITAALDDLPAANSRRVSLGEVQPQAYEMMRELTRVAPEDAYNIYKQMVDQGLRVAPTPGSSFMYSGEYHGTKLGPRELPTSGRANYIIKTNFLGDEYITSDNRLWDDSETKWDTLDLNKIDPNDFLSADPADAPHLLSQDPQVQQRWVIAAQTHDIRTLREMAKEGHSVHAIPDPRKQGWLSRTVFSKKPLTADAVVPAYYPLTRAEQEPGFARETASIPPTARGRVEIRGEPSPFASVESRKRTSEKAVEIAGYLQDLQPVIGNILKRFGAKNRPQLVIDLGLPNSTPSPSVKPATGEIFFPADYERMIQNNAGNSFFFGDTKTQIQQIVYHELGHIVGIRSWDNLPYDVKATVRQGYQRARLNYALTGENAMVDSLVREPSSSDHKYYLTFDEYVAEQFRRWANSDQMVLTDADRFFHKGARELDKVYTEIDAKWGPEVRNQLFQSDWSFNSWMDYLEKARNPETGWSPLQFIREASRMSWEPPAMGDLQQAFDVAYQQVAEFNKLLPVDWQVELSNESRVSPEAGTVELGYADKANKVIRFMVGSLAWVSSPELMKAQAARTMAHELWHSVEDQVPASARRLLRDTGKELNVLDPKIANAYYKDFFKQFREMGQGVDEAKALAREYTDREYVAKVIERYAQGHSFGDKANTLLEVLSRFAERVGNMLRGYGFRTADDIIYAFYRGKITENYNRAQAKRGIGAKPRQSITTRERDLLPRIKTAKGDDVYVMYDPYEGGAQYEFFNPDRTLAGYIDIDDRGEIQMINAKGLKGRGLPEAMIDYVEKHRGGPLKTAQLLTNMGYNMLKRRAPDRVKYYVKDTQGNFWVSPKAVWENIDRLSRLAHEYKDTAAPEKGTIEERLSYWRELAKQIPDTAKEDPILLKQWQRRGIEMDQWQHAAQQRGTQLAHETSGQASNDVESPYDLLQRMQRKGYERRGEAPPQPEIKQRSINGLFRRYGDRNPEVRRRISGTTRGTELDRTYTLHIPILNKQIQLGKYALTLRQMAWRNPHIPELREYQSLRDQENSRTMEVIARADARAREWDNLPRQQSDRLSQLLFWATEMRYRSANEVRNRVVRQPTQQELAAQIRQLGLSREAVGLYQRVNGDFTDFLTRMDGVFRRQIQQRFMNNPQQMAVELAKLTADMAQLRRRPYFPMVRFGKYALTGRRPTAAGGRGRVEFFALYPTPEERDAAVTHVHNHYQGQLDLSITQVPESAFDFMGLPGPLLERIKNQLPGITAQQSDWIDRFSQLMAPEQSFKKRWLRRQGTTGYSLDGLRAYAQYFRSGSRYLSRIEFNDPINNVMNSLDQSVRNAADGTSRQIIADMVRSHAKDMNTAGKDWSKLKALTFFMQLGFSPAAAAMNLTQVPVVSYPYLSRLFGERSVLELGENVARAGARTLFTRGLQNLQGTPGLDLAHAEMVSQGRIDIGQAAELGSFAESSRIDQSWLGDRFQRAARTASYWSSWMFGNVERFNREWLFETAYKLALDNPNNRHVQELQIQKYRDHQDVMARTGMTSDQAAAFLVAREAIDRTQFNYQDRPKALRGPVAQATRIYFMYTQHMLFALANNPGRLKMALILGALYGAMGMPGADDLDAFVHLLAVKVFGKDFNLKKATREYVRQATKGTFLDEYGPDLALHGISRYGFGMSLLPEFMGWPQFDASGNGSMGKLIPGFADAMNGWANSGGDPDAWKNTSTKVLQDLAGPGLGVFFPWMKSAMAAPYSGDQSKWEAVLPRGFRAMADAYHMWENKGITAPNGARTAKLDPNDPNDRATIIAQALGFTPRVRGEQYEVYEMMNNTKMFYQGKKMELSADLVRAIRNQDAQAQSDVVAGLKKYNEDVVKDGHPELAVKVNTFVSGIRTRMKNIAKTEANIPLQKSDISLQRNYQQLVPGQIKDQRRVQ
jgi:hypothetical protein